MQECFDKSIPIFKRYKYRLNDDYLNDLIGVLEDKKPKYFYCPTFLFLPLSEDLIKEILLYNNASTAQISKYTELFSLIQTLNLRSPNKYLINLEKIREHLSQESVVLDSFSFLMGTTVSVHISCLLK